MAIRNIHIKGNRITKRYIIEREVLLQKGQRYPFPALLDAINRTQENLNNTALFVQSVVDFNNWVNDSIDITVDVQERWYLYPVPYVKVADRNLNVWMRDFKFDPSRLNYGIKFTARNVTGRNDNLKLWLINGYTQRFSLKYYNPFADRSLQHGWGIDFLTSRNKEINYDTRGNKQQFFRDDKEYIRRQFYLGGVYSYRKGSVDRHFVRLGMVRERVGDTVLKLNGNYFGKGIQQLSYPEFRYTYQHFNVDYIPYPLKGNTFEFEYLRKGLNSKVDLNQFFLRAGKFFYLDGGFYASTEAELHLKAPFNQPFFTQTMLGYQDSYLRGLEYYVIDGVAGGFIRNTVRKQLLYYENPTGLRSGTYEKIPFRIYLKGYMDAGYVYNRNNLTGNTLTGKFLYSGGIGIDIVSIYDIVLGIEFSFNQLGQNGLFLHRVEPKNQ